MELGTFGAVIKFALELEAMAAAFYETASVITSTEQLKIPFEAYIQKRLLRMETLKRLRRENTTEMILEPIHGLQDAEYRVKSECPEGCPDEELLKLASEMEERNQKFYTDAAQKIEFLIESAEIFDRFAEENGDNAQSLRKMK